MKKLYIANTNFEFELAQNIILSIQQMMEASPICLQLQFLPLLFADSDDEVLVSSLPGRDFPNLVLDAHDREVHSWGWSKSIEKWASQRKLVYNMPPWEVVRLVNSKAWSFQNSLKLEGAASIFSKKELENWIAINGYCQAVAKSCYGVSGRGNVLFKEISAHLLSFCEKEWRVNRPVIIEPWVDRVLDFSSQWQVESDKITFLGATKMLNSANGTYLGTIVGNENLLFNKYRHFYEMHLIEAKKLLVLAQQAGYYGYAGIDAMIYQKRDALFLQPIVELNARMTMALAAILIQKKRFPNENLLFQYGNFTEGYLPRCIQSHNKIIHFNKQLQIMAV